jgi:hypothetical protein
MINYKLSKRTEGASNCNSIGNENTGLNINSLGEDENGELCVLNKKLPDQRV